MASCEPLLLHFSKLKRRHLGGVSLRLVCTTAKQRSHSIGVAFFHGHVQRVHCRSTEGFPRRRQVLEASCPQKILHRLLGCRNLCLLFGGICLCPLGCGCALTFLLGRSLLLHALRLCGLLRQLAGLLLLHLSAATLLLRLPRALPLLQLLELAPLLGAAALFLLLLPSRLRLQVDLKQYLLRWLLRLQALRGAGTEQSRINLHRAVDRISSLARLARVGTHCERQRMQ